MNARRRCLKSLAGVLGVCALTPVWALGQDRAGSALAARLTSVDDWRRWGTGEYRWFGLPMYSATLWVAGADWTSAPHSLEIVYQRDLSASRLVRTSIDLMARAGADTSLQARARLHLQRLLPDVRSGESLRAIHVPGVGLRLHHGATWRGDVEDPEFARRFMAIWLGEHSVAPELRAALLMPPR